MERESAQHLTPDQEAELERIVQEIEQTYLADGKIDVQEARAIVQLSERLAPVQAEALYQIRQRLRDRWGAGDGSLIDFDD